MATAATRDLPILAFKTQKAWKQWLHKNHTRADGIWLRFYKKHSGVATVTYAEALEEALCYGWIDSQTKRYDEDAYLQKFSPRRKRSPWSQINVEKVERLIQEGRMQPAGLREVEAAKADGRWDAATKPVREMTAPEDFLQALEKNTKAKAFFATLNRMHTHYVRARLSIKNPQTRAQRIEEMIAQLANGQKLT